MTTVKYIRDDGSVQYLTGNVSITEFDGGMMVSYDGEAKPAKPGMFRDYSGLAWFFGSACVVVAIFYGMVRVIWG